MTECSTTWELLETLLDFLLLNLPLHFIPTAISVPRVLFNFCVQWTFAFSSLLGQSLNAEMLMSWHPVLDFVESSTNGHSGQWILMKLTFPASSISVPRTEAHKHTVLSFLRPMGNIHASVGTVCTSLLSWSCSTGWPQMPIFICLSVSIYLSNYLSLSSTYLSTYLSLSTCIHTYIWGWWWGCIIYLPTYLYLISPSFSHLSLSPLLSFPTSFSWWPSLPLCSKWYFLCLPAACWAIPALTLLSACLHFTLKWPFLMSLSHRTLCLRLSS